MYCNLELILKNENSSFLEQIIFPMLYKYYKEKQKEKGNYRNESYIRKKKQNKDIICNILNNE